MGLFNKSKNQVEDIFGLEDESSPVANQYTPQRQEPQSTKTVKSNSTTNAYGIEDAIKLMRQLPKVDSEILITVVNKTLESANIKVSTIIADAEGKESNIKDRNVRLGSRIKELESEISQLNEEITVLTADLKETSKVKELLQLSVKQPGSGSNQEASREEHGARAKSPKMQQGNQQQAVLVPSNSSIQAKETA